MFANYKAVYKVSGKSPAEIMDACSHIPKFRLIERTDENERVSKAELKAGLSFLSWGEIINVTVESKTAGNVHVSIESRCFWQFFDFGKNRKNVQTIAEQIGDTVRVI